MRLRALERRLLLDASLPILAGNILHLDASDQSTILDADGDAADSGSFNGGIETWQDKSGLGNHAIDGTENRNPDTGLATQNGLNTVSFDGTQVLTTDISATLSDYTLFAVVSHDDWTDNTRREFMSSQEDQTGLKPLDWGVENDRLSHWRGNADGIVMNSEDSSAFGGYQIIAFTQDRTGAANVDATYFLNSSQIETATGNWENLENDIYIGASLGNSSFDFGWTGNMAEVLVYDHVLSADERHDVDTYLAGKWGLTVPNNGPSIDADNASVDEGATLTVNNTHLSSSDIDNTDTNLSYTINSLAAKGTLKIDGIDAQINDTFTQQDIIDGKITYTHDGSETLADSLDFTVSDGLDQVSGTFTLTINPVNDDPVLDTNTGTVLDEGADTTITSSMLSASDAENVALGEWYDDSWQYRQKITIDPANIDADLTDFSILLTEDNFTAAFWNNVQNDGGDIVITAADGTTRLSRELVDIDTGLHTMELHAKIPDVSSAASTDFYIYYGNAAATESNDASAWDNNFAGIWHLGETSGDAQDSTLNNLDGTINGDPVQGAAGAIGGSADFDGSGDFIDMGTHAVHAPSSITLSAWVNMRAAGSSHQFIVGKGPVSNDGYELVIDKNSADNFWWATDNNWSVNNTAHNMTAGNWTHLVLSYDETAGTTVYANGVLVDTDPTTGALNTGAGDFQIGRRADNALNFFNGLVDEVRLSSTARSAEWILAEYANQLDPSGFYSIDAAEQYTGPVEYEITSTPVNGPLYLDANANSTPDVGEVLAVTDVFTQDDIDNGLVKYLHDDSETLADNFAFTITDGNTVVGPSTFSITINPVFDGDDMDSIPDQVFHFDAQDIDADGDTGDQPGDETATGTWTDGSGNNLNASQGTGSRQPVYDSDAFGGRGGIRFDGGSDYLDISNSGLINTGSYDEKSFAIAFETGADVSGTQVIYEQGGGYNGYNIALVGGDIYAYVWGESYFAGDKTVKLNLGPAQTDTAYTLLMVHDARDGDLANRTFSVSLNSGALQTINGVDVQGPHSGNVTLGHSGDSQNPATDANLGSGYYFEGSIGEFWSWNHALSAQEIDNVNTFLNNKWINEAPTLATNSTLDVIQATQSAIQQADLETTDTDNSPGDLTYTLTGLPTDGTLYNSGIALGLGDTFTQDDINNNLVAYNHGGGPLVPDSFDFTVSDGMETIGGFTFDINITAQPASDPFVTTNLPLNINEGASVTITTASLEATDNDTPDNTLTYEITSAVSQGSLERSGIALGLGDTFTQQDIIDGLITYTHDDSENFSDGFDFTVTDGGTTTADETFGIIINPVSDQDPTDIALTSSSVNENSPAGTLIGTLSGTDADLPGDTLTFSIVNDPDNKFRINGDRLEVDGALNYETKASHNVTIRVDDGQGGTYDEAFVITVNDVNENPTSLSLSNNSVDENTATGTLIGTLSATDPDLPGDTFSYSITSDPDNKFRIVGNRLEVDGSLDFETSGSHSVTIRVSDGQGGTRTQGYTININDVNDVPVAQGNNGILAQGKTLVLDTDILSATDVDNPDNALIFEITAQPSAGQLQLSGADIGIGDIFTQQDIIDGNVTYIHDAGATAASDSFSFTVTDGALTTGAATADLEISPALETNNPVNLDEGDTYTIQDTDLSYDAAWYNDNWAYRQAITVDSSLIDADLEDFAIMLTEDGFGAGFWNNVKADGSDIVITSADGVTRLDRELTTIDTVGESMQLYARTGLSSTADTTLYVYYGNAAASETNQATTWRSEYTGVWHFDDDFNDGSVHDSSQEGNHGYTRNGFNGANQVAGQSGSAAEFNKSEYLALDYGYSGDNSLPEVSVSTWVNTTYNTGGYNDNWSVIDFDRSEYFNVFINTDGRVGFSTAGDGFSLNDFYSDGATVNDGDWHHIAAVYDGSDKILYVDGNEVQRIANVHGGRALGDGTRYGFIGDGSEAGSFDASRNNIYYDGLYDDMRLYEGTMSGAWIAAEYENQSNPSSFYSVGSQVKLGRHIQYTLADAPDNGALFIDANSNGIPDGGEALAATDTFTQEDINTGILLYRHDGGETLGDSFDFTVADSQGHTSVPDTLSISINPVNDTPTDIGLSNATLNEHTAVNSLIGNLSATDADLPGDTFTYSIQSDPDGKFQINGNRLELASALNYEVSGTHNVTIRVDDGNGGTYDEAFVITVTDVNDTPSDISLDNSDIMENSPPGELVGTFSTTDEDLPGDTFTYTIQNDPAGKFRINGDRLEVDAAINHELVGSHSVTVRTDDGQGGIYDETFTITIVDINDAPTAIALDNLDIYENSSAGTLVGLLSATDEDLPGDEFTYTFIDNPGDKFRISGNRLEVQGALDFETLTEHEIRLQVDDGKGGTYDELFTIKILDVTENGGFIAPEDSDGGNAGDSEGSDDNYYTDNAGYKDSIITIRDVSREIRGDQEIASTSKDIIRTAPELNNYNNLKAFYGEDGLRQIIRENITVPLNDLSETGVVPGAENDLVSSGNPSPVVPGGIAGTSESEGENPEENNANTIDAHMQNLYRALFGEDNEGNIDNNDSKFSGVIDQYHSYRPDTSMQLVIVAENYYLSRIERLQKALLSEE